MDKKGQAGPVTFIFIMLFFFIMLFLIGGTLWTLVGQAGETVGLSGIESFIYNNLGLIVVLSSLLGIMAYFYIGGSK